MTDDDIEVDAPDAVTIRAADLRVGDVICEGPERRTKIRRLEVGESCRGLHVNGSDCWDPISRLVVLRDVPAEVSA